MLKNILKSLFILIILFLVSSSNIFASGKMEVIIGEKVTLQGSNVKSGFNYKWIIKQGKEIINTQTSPIFNYTFLNQGEYDVNLVLTDSSGRVKSTSVYVLAGDRYKRPVLPGSEPANGTPDEEHLSVIFSTLPPIREDRAIHLIGDGKVVFDIEVNRSDIIEYRIDRNVFEDSDENGIANDDIDNAGDDSYLIGGVWSTNYSAEEASKIVAEITIVTKKGEKAKAQATVIFDDHPRLTGDPFAVLDITPSYTEDGQIIYLYGDTADVSFYARRSEGKILEYRIDRNIFEDSNGDGNPSNDIDNLNDISFKTGDVWTTKYNRTDEQIIAQLTAVGEGGKGSRVQREFSFTDKPKTGLGSADSKSNRLMLSADKSFVLKGDVITFTVQGLSQNSESYVFKWDFDGDGEVDKESEGENSISHIYDFAEIYNVGVNVTDLQGNSADFNLNLLVKEKLDTFADFDFKIEEKTVSFTNKSVSALNLADKNLDYNWSFGDTDAKSYEDQKAQIGIANPVYTYSGPGTYIVTLTVADSDQVTISKSSEIVIEGSFEVSDDVIGGDVLEKEKSGSFIVKILKVILYLILIIIVLIILIFVGFIGFLKIQHPDLTFEELIDELKLKILTMLGVDEDMVDIQSDDQIAESVQDEEVIVPASDNAQVSEEVEQSEPEPEVEPEPVQSEPEVEPEAEEGEIIDSPSEMQSSESAEEVVKEDVSDDDSDNDNNPPSTPPTPSTTPPEDLPPKAEEDSSSKDVSSPKKDNSLNNQDGPVPDWLRGA